MGAALPTFRIQTPCGCCRRAAGTKPGGRGRGPGKAGRGREASPPSSPHPAEHARKRPRIVSARQSKPSQNRNEGEKGSAWKKLQGIPRYDESSRPPKCRRRALSIPCDARNHTCGARPDTGTRLACALCLDAYGAPHGRRSAGGSGANMGGCTYKARRRSSSDKGHRAAAEHAASC